MRACGDRGRNWNMRLCRAFLQYALHMTANDTLGSPYSSPDPNEHGDQSVRRRPPATHRSLSRHTRHSMRLRSQTTRSSILHRVPTVIPWLRWTSGTACALPVSSARSSSRSLASCFRSSRSCRSIKTGEKSRGMAIAGIVIGGISTALALIAIIMVICGLAIGLGALARNRMGRLRVPLRYTQ